MALTTTTLKATPITSKPKLWRKPNKDEGAARGKNETAEYINNNDILYMTL